MIKVELIDSAGGDLSIVNSARVSFDKQSEYDYELTDLGENKIDVKEKLSEADAKLVRYLAKHRHDTPFRHNFVQLRCSAPVFLARQLMKHQAGLTWNEVSKRYVDTVPDMYYPTKWRKRPDDGIKQGSGTGHPFSPRWARFYEDHIEQCCEIYRDMIRDGIAPEMARMVLPQSMMVDFIWSGNLLAFHHVWKLRSGEGAQIEAREFAEKLHDAIKPAFPVGWDALTNR